MSLNKIKLNEIRKEIEQKFFELDCAGIGVELKLGNCSYSDTHATFKLEVQVKGGDTKEMSDLKQISSYRNLDLDKVYIEGRHHFKLVGWKSRARKKPFIVKDIKTDSQYVISEDVCDKWFKKLKEKVSN
tara:strand:+ start:910 stop:1299 length:390 start_codon:yes stop_codon:yes gene_type:complete